jgi:hypothetical protein
MAIEITTADSTTITGIRNALNSAPLSGAAGWDSVYTTTGSNSAKWSQAYTNLVSNSAAYLSGGPIIDISLLAAASASWNSVYTTTNANSASWDAGNGDVIGPEIATDNAIARYNLSTGKLLQNSLATVSDNGAIVAPSVGSVIPFYHDNQLNFPNATVYQGALAHSRADGRVYFAHNNTWNGLSNVTDLSNNTVLVSSSNVILSACTVTTHLSVGGIIYSNQINTINEVGTGTFILSSGSDIQLSAVNRVAVTNTPFRLVNLTSIQRDALAPQYGDMIYNTTTNKFQGYASVGWVDLS